MSVTDIKKILPEIEHYFSNPQNGGYEIPFPQLSFVDKDGDGLIDLFDPLGNELNLKYREVSPEWAHLLRPIAINNRESAHVELSVKDWLIHKKSLDQKNSGRIVLPNGLQLIVEYKPDRPLVWAGFAVFAGSIDEEPRQRGISHALEHVVGSGGPLGSRDDLEDKLTQLSASTASVDTKFDRTFYSFYADPTHIDEAFHLWDITLMNGIYDQKRVDSERDGSLQEEMRRAESMLPMRIHEHFRHGLYPDHPFGDRVCGEIENIRNLSLKDLSEYHANHYVPNNIAIKFTGPITLERALRIVKNSSLGSKPPHSVTRPALQLAPPKDPSISIIESGTSAMAPSKTTEVRVGYRVSAWIDRPDNAALDIAMHIISQRMKLELVKTGRLNRASIWSQDAGGVGLIVLTLSGTVDKIHDALLDAKRIIEQVKRYPPTKAETERAKHTLLAESSLEYEESEKRLMPSLRNARYADPIADTKKRAMLMRAADAIAVQQAAKKYLAGSGSHTLVVLEKDIKSADFVEEPVLLEQMKEISEGKVKRPNKLSIDAQARYPKLYLPPNFHLRQILQKAPEQLSNKRLRYELKNGVVVIHVPNSEGDIIASTIRSPMGNDTDPRGKEGLRELLVRNLFRGTNDISFERFKQEMDYLRARYDAIAGFEDFSINLAAPKESFADSFLLLLRAILNPRLNKEDLGETKLGLENERRALENDPSFIANYIPEIDIYPNKASVRPSLGNTTTVKAVGSDDLNIYLSSLLAPWRLEVTLGGHFSNEKQLQRILYALSLIPQAKTSRTIQDEPDKSVDRYPFKAHLVTDPVILRHMGINNPAVTATHTPQNIATNCVSIQMLGPPRNSWEFPYFFAFRILYANRVFYRLVYGKKKGRENTTGYLYKAWTLHDVVESDQSVVARYEFECKPSQMGTVLADIQDEYLQTVGGVPDAHKPTQDELKIKIQNHRLDWMISTEGISGQVAQSVEHDHLPWFFRKEGTLLGGRNELEAVYGREEAYRRLATLPIDEVLKVGGKYFDISKQKARFHIVGQLP